MFANSAYLHNTHSDDADLSHAITVKSCGNYRLSKRLSFTTYRPRGRGDFQLLYIASGKTHFFFDDTEQILSEGNIVIYQPGERQKYIYYAKEKPEIFWIHFSGTEAKKMLRHYGLTKQNIFHTGTISDLNQIFLEIISELRTQAPYSGELLTLLLQKILLLVSRNTFQSNTAKGFKSEIDRAIIYFNEHCSKEINIESYAKKCHVSVSWFIRSFKKYAGMSPMQYILNARISNAKSLLETSECSIAEISAIVGYDNPMYFSRIFKKQTGLPPLEYRKKHSS